MNSYIKELAIKLDVLNEEIKVIESRIPPHACGHLKPAVNVMKERAKEIREELYNFNE